VTTTTRSPVLPEMPTVSESVPGYDTSTWIGIGEPKGIPAQNVESLNKEINAALTDQRSERDLSTWAMTTLTMSPDDFRKLVADETEN
jgi:tripartite-type tricarboxylate transporter receptor subunit TctC